MGRLTDCKHCTVKCPQEELACEIAKGRMYATDEVIKLQKELQKYKDLEEQGRLIEQKHGRWIEHEGPYFKCSVCGISEVSQGLYCRNCGAKMDEVEGDKE